jgi:hypothetical protein
MENRVFSYIKRSQWVYPVLLIGNIFAVIQVIAMKVKQKQLLFLFMMITLLHYSCKDNSRKEEAAKIVNEWTGKEIRFPENVPCYVLGKDTLPELCNKCFGKEYKILLYVDSTGCSSCRLKLFLWKQLMEEADSLFQGKVGFLLFFQPKSVKEMNYLFIRDRFDYPVFMDVKSSINDLNHFPQAMQYQCFLLDKNNKVLMVGNPVLNQKIWELYKEQISGGKKAEPEIITSIQMNKAIHDYGTIRKGSKNPAVFTITNTGEHPLIISRVSASCGCTNVTWDKQPVEPGKQTTIRVEMTPEETGHFSKTVEVYCNAKESPVKLMLTGKVEN